MLAAMTWLGLAIAAQAPEHDANPVYAELVGGKLTLEGTAVPIPGPSLADGASEKEQEAALVKVAGSAAKAKEMVRDSVTAPHVLKPPHDAKSRGGGTLRFIDLWFVVHADLDAVAPEGFEPGGPVEAGNMKFESHRLDAAELKEREVEVAPKDEWYAHLRGRLLDRVEFGSTDRVVASKSGESLVVASRTAAAFDRDKQYPNLWRKIFKSAGGAPTAPGPALPYLGGGSYVKITRLKAHPGALLVEVHAAFLEPREWFEGAPILRSKVGLAAEDRIRGLRRELAKRQGTGESAPKPGEPGAAEGVHP